MRIAIFNPYKNKVAAENAVDFVYEKISEIDGNPVEIKSFCSCEEIADYSPDFILSHSSFSVKFCGIPTYVIFNESAESRLKCNNDIRAYLTFDGYLTQSDFIAQSIRDMCFAFGKKCNLLTPFANSRSQNSFCENINLSSASLAYCGNNWEIVSGGFEGKKPRFEKMFLSLTSELKVDFLRLYGDEKGWSWIKKKSYVKGKIDFDNPESLLDVYRDAGIGLALSSHDFYRQGLANNRIYEIVSSGAVCIADDLSFYRDIFGDNLLYIDSRDEMEMARQICVHVQWVRQNPDLAREKAKKAHQIFCQKLSAEKMLTSLIGFHKDVMRSNYFVEGYRNNDSTKPLVSVVVRSGGRDRSMVEETLKSIAKQTYSRIEVVFVLYKNNPGLTDLVREYENFFEKLVVINSSSKIRSSVVLSGFNAASGDYIALLDDDDVWYPNHASKMVEFFDLNLRADFVYSGRVYRRSDQGDSRLPGSYLADLLDGLNKIVGSKSSYDLGGFGETNYDEMMSLNHPIHPCFMVKKSSLPEEFFIDPLIHDCEDLYITALLYRAGLKFYWMPELTMQMNVHGENSSISAKEEVEIKNRIALRVLGIASWKEVLDRRQKIKQIDKIARKFIKIKKLIKDLRPRFAKFTKNNENFDY